MQWITLTWLSTPKLCHSLLISQIWFTCMIMHGLIRLASQWIILLTWESQFCRGQRNPQISTPLSICGMSWSGDWGPALFCLPPYRSWALLWIRSGPPSPRTKLGSWSTQWEAVALMWFQLMVATLAIISFSNHNLIFSWIIVIITLNKLKTVFELVYLP